MKKTASIHALKSFGKVFQQWDPSPHLCPTSLGNTLKFTPLFVPVSPGSGVKFPKHRKNERFQSLSLFELTGNTFPSQCLCCSPNREDTVVGPMSLMSAFFIHPVIQLHLNWKNPSQQHFREKLWDFSLNGSSSLCSNGNAKKNDFSCSLKPVLRMTDLSRTLFIYLKGGEFNVQLGSDLWIILSTT